MDPYEKVWAEREEVVYPRLFGKLEPNIALLTEDLFQSLFQVSPLDPAWLHFGVLLSPPNENRPTWLYVTSGMSNPLDETFNESDPSGYGVEFTLETKDYCEWAIVLLQKLMAYNLMLPFMEGAADLLIDFGHRIPLNGSISLDEPSALTWVFINVPEHHEHVFFNLPSGVVLLMRIIGISESEQQYAKEHGNESLLEKLKVLGADQITDAAREAVV